MAAKSAILTYHSLDDSGSVISLPPRVFREHIEILLESRVRVVPLREIRTSPGAVALTFDDGYANFLQEALPYLAKRGMAATVFAVSGRCGQQSDWPGSPGLPLLDWSQLRELHTCGIEIGSHSVSHPNLTRLSAGAARAEMAASRKEMEDRLGVDVTSFAYPYGASNAGIRTAASDLFDAACGTRMRFTSPESDPFDLPRLDVYYFRDPRRFRALAEGRAGTYVGWRAALREARARLLPA